MVNEPSVFEPLKFYCTIFISLFADCINSFFFLKHIKDFHNCSFREVKFKYMYGTHVYESKRLENLSGTVNRKSCFDIQKPSNRDPHDPHLGFLFHVSPWPKFY